MIYENLIISKKLVRKDSKENSFTKTIIKSISFPKFKIFFIK